MRLQVRVGHTRALLAAAGLTLAAGAALAWIGFRALAERERTVATQYAATTVLVRDRLTAELTRIESELRAGFVRAAASLHDRTAARNWLSLLTHERPWIADPVLFDGTGGVLTPDLAAGWRDTPPRGPPDAAFMALIREAESSEFTGDLQKALARYRGAATEAASPVARALADMRIGRVLYKLQHYDAGLERYRAVMESAGDLTDAHGIPYMVSALRQMSAGFATLQRTSDRQDAERRLREYVIRRPWNVADGYDVCRALRKAEPALPILMLTARGQEDDVILGLKLGADDYVKKPFSVAELVARIETLLRRSPGAGGPAGIEFGDVSVDFIRHQATKAGAPIDLTVKEFDLLRYFASHRGRVVSRDALLNAVWGYDSVPNTRTVDAHIVKLRQKIEETPHEPRHLLTVHGMGYKFIG